MATRIGQPVDSGDFGRRSLFCPLPQGRLQRNHPSRQRRKSYQPSRPSGKRHRFGVRQRRQRRYILLLHLLHRSGFDLPLRPPKRKIFAVPLSGKTVRSGLFCSRTAPDPKQRRNFDSVFRCPASEQPPRRRSPDLPLRIRRIRHQPDPYLLPLGHRMDGTGRPICGRQSAGRRGVRRAVAPGRNESPETERFR